MALADAAFVLSPVGGTHTEATRSWSAPDNALVGTWGRRPERHGTPVSLAGFAVAREFALLRIRRHRRGARVHRLPPPALRATWYGRLAARSLRSGALVELRPPSAPSRLETILDESRWAASGPIRVGSGGGVLVPVTRNGARGVLRAGRRDHAGDPSTDAAALVAMTSVSVPAPALLDRGEFDGVRWTVASRVDGRPAGAASLETMGAVEEILREMPRDVRKPRAPFDDLAALRTAAQGAAPGLATDLDRLESRLRQLCDRTRSVARHGDLWAGNVLLDRGAVAAFVDWDAYHPSAVGGTDILELVATERRLLRRLTLGDVWRTEPWREAVVTRHLQAIDGDTDAARVSWWLAEAANSVRRDPDLMTDRRWLDVNLGSVLASLL